MTEYIYAWNKKIFILVLFTFQSRNSKGRNSKAHKPTSADVFSFWPFINTRAGNSDFTQFKN